MRIIALIAFAASVSMSLCCSAQGQSLERNFVSSVHRVTLSWSSSLPASKLPKDKIIGYIIYRSTKSHDRNAKPVNLTQVTGTVFTDSQVEPGQTYFYVTRAVNANGLVSGPSNEVRVQIPR